MRIDEAIEIKETELEGSAEHFEEELRKAEMLSIEALKRIAWQHQNPDRFITTPLPGETKE